MIIIIKLKTSSLHSNYYSSMMNSEMKLIKYIELYKSISTSSDSKSRS